MLVEPLPAGHWFVGGQPAARPTALLAIDITAGTNTAAQKARFVEAAFAELQRQLGTPSELETASYVQVRELAAGDWGFGGITQATRAARHSPREAREPAVA